MPNVRSMQIGETGFEIVASDGRSISMTRDQIKAFFDAQAGPLPQRIQATLNFVRSTIETALGTEQLPIRQIIDLDFAQETGRLLRLEIGG